MVGDIGAENKSAASLVCIQPENFSCITVSFSGFLLSVFCQKTDCGEMPDFR